MTSVWFDEETKIDLRKAWELPSIVAKLGAYFVALDSTYHVSFSDFSRNGLGFIINGLLVVVLFSGMVWPISKAKEASPTSCK